MATGGKYQVYIKRWIPASGDDEGAWETEWEIEDSIPGLRYKLCEGLEDQGEPKFYTEDYAETSVPRVHLTDKVKTTDIRFEFIFMDTPQKDAIPATSRFEWKDLFTSEITGYRFIFRDSKRNISREMFLSGKVKVKESVFYDGKPYIIVEYPCTSMNTEMEAETD